MEWIYVTIGVIILYVLYVVFGWLYNKIIYPIIEVFSPEVVKIPRFNVFSDLPSKDDLVKYYSSTQPALYHLKKFPDFFKPLFFWRGDFTIVSSIFYVNDGALHSYMRHYAQWNHIQPEMDRHYGKLPKELKDLMKSYMNSNDGTPENVKLRDKIQTFLKAQPKDSKTLETIALIEREILRYLSTLVKSEGNFSEDKTKSDTDAKVEWIFTADDNTEIKMVFAPQFRNRTHDSSKGRQIYKLITAYMYFY